VNSYQHYESIFDTTQLQNISQYWGKKETNKTTEKKIDSYLSLSDLNDCHKNMFFEMNLFRDMR
jgi:hypothetical protein